MPSSLTEHEQELLRSEVMPELEDILGDVGELDGVEELERMACELLLPFQALDAPPERRATTTPTRSARSRCSAIYRGAVGVDALNERLRARLNPQGAPCLDGPLRTGDKLIQTRNDYSTGLMNGQIVIALGEDEDGDGEQLLVETDAGERLAVPAERTHSLRPAYAISVHKSQGCEMPVVIVPVHSSHTALLSRNLLYTAVTRARRACVVVGQRQAVTRALRRADAFQRNSRLAGLLAAEAAASPGD